MKDGFVSGKIFLFYFKTTKAAKAELPVLPVFGHISSVPESHRSSSAPPARHWKGEGGSPPYRPALPGCASSPALLDVLIVGRKALGRVETWCWQLLRKPRVVRGPVPKASGNPNPRLENLPPHPRFPSPPR